MEFNNHCIQTVQSYSSTCTMFWCDCFLKLWGPARAVNCCFKMARETLHSAKQSSSSNLVFSRLWKFDKGQIFVPGRRFSDVMVVFQRACNTSLHLRRRENNGCKSRGIDAEGRERLSTSHKLCFRFQARCMLPLKLQKCTTLQVLRTFRGKLQREGQVRNFHKP